MFTVWQFTIGDISRLVIETLKEVDGERKCCRLVGGILVERTVQEVLPALEHNKEQIQKLIESLGKQIQSKSAELTEYREKYNIKVKGEQPPSSEEEKGLSASQGVLVAKDSK
ncbi:putative prefoldin subunit 2 [Apostichopus japonicus]|uniref:Putative prefoldin subunit 2 n=1 Tax=Stichopus japonicus TaxID=307972 RepID=A0A2G8KD47_STIJA|nr:putative prefoldin subunit 2 [Apostichopus japonicus]